MTITQASIKDLESISNLFDSYRVFYGQRSDIIGAREFISQRISNKESIIFLATDLRGLALGFAQIFPTFSSVSLKRVYILNDLYVDNAYRRQGVAKNILNGVSTFCKSIGVARLQLCTACDNTEAKSLYESEGWQLNETFDYYTLPL